jgi:methylenetetrahydrofolate dehydrogenase (NADP+)/methenyltetrahydrofolate cyclohydrolase
LDTVILDGKLIATGIREEVKARAAELSARGVEPRLAVLLVGDDAGSRIYSESIRKAGSALGIAVDLLELAADEGETRIADAVAGLSNDDSVSGIIVQQPLPAGVSGSIVEGVAPGKDVDGATTLSMGLLMVGREGFAPATPLGVIETLVRSGISIPSKHVVIVGRSAVVGRPLASLLLRKNDKGNATVTVCHTRTGDLAHHTRGADIVVAAMGRPRAITGDMIRDGAVVVDVGVNRVEDPESSKGYRIVGDAAFDEMIGKASAITPVPGGVGRLTTALLLRNTVEAAERRIEAVRS